jgi:hypothetical protein
MDPDRPITNNIVPFALESPFYFDSDLSATRGRHVTIIVVNEHLTSLFAVFKLFHAFICNRFENTQISYTQIMIIALSTKRRTSESLLMEENGKRCVRTHVATYYRVGLFQSALLITVNLRYNEF